MAKDDVLKEFITLPGVGMSKAKLLYSGGFKSMDDLEKASMKEITARKGINKKLATDIFEFFHPEGKAKEEKLPPPPPPEEEKDEPAKEKPKKDGRADELVKHGVDLYKKGKWGQALQSLSEAIRMDPVNEQALIVRGDIYQEREKYDRALESFEILIEINPDSDVPWVKYGDTLLALDRESEALACYKKALEINPENEEAAEHLTEHERMRTFIEGLDEKLQGGIPAKHVVLICGRAGSMKSSLAYSILYNLAKHERTKAVYLTLEQSRSSLLRHMKKLGFDPKRVSGLVVNDLDDMVIVDMAVLRKETALEDLAKVNWLDSIIKQIKDYKKTFGCDIVAIDSMSALYSLTNFTNPRTELFIFFEKLRDIGVTVLLITEMFDPVKEIFGTYGVEEFLADSIIHLKTEKSGKGTNLFLGVVKMRETNHDREYYPLIIDKHGFEIVHD